MRFRGSVTFFLLTLAPVAASADVTFGKNDVETVFAIGKSDDGNQVQYALRLDASCNIVGNDPVFGYWREYDKGPGAPLKSMGWLDGFGYGIDKQTVRSDKTAVSIVIRPAKGRTIDIIATKDGEKCIAKAFTAIGGTRCELNRIFVTLSGPLSVASVAIEGSDVKTGKPVVERIVP